MARNPVCLSVQFKVKTESVSFKFRSVVVTVFERIAVEYTYRISSLFATQFTVEKSKIQSSVSQRSSKTVFIGQLQTLHEISPRENSFGDLH